MTIGLGCLATAISGVSCASPPEVVSHHELALEVEYDGTPLRMKLPFSCAKFQTDWNGSTETVAVPRPHLQHRLPDGSSLLIGTPEICERRFAQQATGQIERPLDAPYSGSVLIPPVAWVDDPKRPMVIEQWASAQAMQNASTGLVVRSATVSPATASGRTDLRLGNWTRTPGQLAGRTAGSMCGAAFVIASSPKPPGFESTEFEGVFWSARRRNFQLDDNFGTGGIAYHAAEFNGASSSSNKSAKLRANRNSRASSIRPLRFSNRQGWSLDVGSADVGFYRSYRISQTQRRLFHTFKMGSKDLPLTWSRQLWLEEEELLLTPIGYCKHWS